MLNQRTGLFIEGIVVYRMFVNWLCVDGELRHEH